ncbi:MAG: CinA family protein [Bacilli bacterium]
MFDVVKILTQRKETIATMESCSGGAIVNSITNIPGASEVLKFSAVTYANEFKIKMGVLKETIDKYSVYSMAVAKEMSKNISLFANSTYGIGITGKINREDPYNKSGENNKIFISIYNKNNDTYNTFSLIAKDADRISNKDYIVEEIAKKLLTIFRNS